MKRVLAFVLAALATASLNLAAIAQTSVGQTVANTLPQMSTPPQPILSASQRAAIARDLVAKWQSAANSRPGGGGARWARILTEVIMSADGQNVLTATTARSIDEVHLALTGGDIAAPPRPATHAIGNGNVVPQTLGHFNNDLVYTPLPNGRCRIADSRVINSPLVGTDSLFVAGASYYDGQGGSGTYANGNGSINCGIPLLTSAYAMSVTLLSSAGAGIFKVFKNGLPYQTGNSITISPGLFSGSADLNVTNCQGCSFEIGIQSSVSVHYVIDIIGYFNPPKRTALSCYRTSVVTSGLGSGSAGNFFAPACGANYTRVSIECSASVGPVQLYHWNGECHGINFSGATANISRASVCCSIPGG